MATSDPGKLVTALDGVAAQAHKDHGDDPRAGDRLAQLDGFVEGAKMAVVALEDERGRREYDRAERVRRAQVDE